MKKFFTLCGLSLMALMPWERVMAENLTVLNAEAAGKTFTIGGERGYWKAVLDKNWIAHTTNQDEATKFAVINYEGRYFLYDADHAKWVTPASGTPGTGTGLALSASPTLAEVSLTNSMGSSRDTYPSVVTFFYGGRQYGISTGYTPSVISYNDLADGGNMAALALTGASVENLESLRTAIANSYVTPFVVSTGTDPSKWVWYHVTLRGNKYLHVVEGKNRPQVTRTFENTDAYKWAFVAGDNRDYTPFSFQIFNKKLGAAKNVKGDGQMGDASAANDNLIISMGGQDGSGFNFRLGENSSTYLNDVNSTLDTWAHGNAKTDNGSTFRVQLAEGLVTLKNAFAVIDNNMSYGYMGATQAGLVAGAQQAGLQNVAHITSTSEAGKVNVSFAGMYAQTVARGTQTTLGNTVVAYKVGRATSYPYYITLGTGTGQQEYLHEAGSQSHKVVGWETSARATNWQVAPAQGILMTANAVGDKFYATLHAPFALQLTCATAYTAKVNLAKNALELTVVESNTVPANTGVVVVADAATYSVTPVLSSAGPLESDLTGVNFSTAWDDNNLSLGRNNGVAGLYKWSGTTLDANKAYLPASKLTDAGVRGLVFDFGGTTAIQGVEAQPGKAAKVFNLQGQQVGDNYRGIVIVNGKKVIQ